MIKVVAIVGFILFAIIGELFFASRLVFCRQVSELHLSYVVDCGGGPDHHYYGTHTWYDPGAFHSKSFAFRLTFYTANLIVPFH